MRKALLFASLLTLGVSAYAQDKKGGQAEFTPSGEFRVRYTNNTNSDLAESGAEGSWASRFKLGGTFRLGDKISGHIGTIHQTTFGEGADSTAPAVDAQYDTFSADNALLVNEAYGNWVLSDNMALKIGRFGLEIGDGTVVAIDDYNQVPNSVEGWMFSYDLEFAKFGLIAITHEEIAGPDAASSMDDDEAATFGLNVDVKSVPDALKTVNVHALKTHQDEAAAAGSDVLRYGLTLGGDMAGFMYKLTYAMYSGTTIEATEVDLSETMMDLTVGYSMPDMMKFKVAFNYHTDSGDNDNDAETDSKYEAFMYDSHEAAGLMDIVEWGNLTDMNLKFSIEPMENFAVELAYHMFSATVQTDGALDVATANINGASINLDDGEASIGTEIDLTLTQKYSNGMNAGLRYSTFTPGTAIETNGGEEVATQWQLFTSASF